MTNLNKELERYISLLKEGENIENLQIDEPDKEHILMELGEYFNKHNEKIIALNCFNHILYLNPENTKAKTYREMILNILNFFHKDLLNP